MTKAPACPAPSSCSCSAPQDAVCLPRCWHHRLEGVPGHAATQRVCSRPAAAFAYIDAAGRRRFPIHDVSHVRNALARSTGRLARTMPRVSAPASGSSARRNDSASSRSASSTGSSAASAARESLDRAERAGHGSERRNVPLVNVPTIIVTGPVGVGKTTVAGEMGLHLLDAKVPHATVDFDQLTACYPRPTDDDRWGTKLGLMNLAALWKNYERSGARRLLIARVLESRSELDGFRGAVPGADILVVRLRAGARGAPVAGTSARTGSRDGVAPPQSRRTRAADGCAAC